MNTLRQPILVLATALAFLSPAARAEQPQKASRVTTEERVKQLEERADAAEKAAGAAAMDREYILRTQKLYETYYQKTLTTELWTLGLVSLLLAAVFGLVVRFSLNLFEQRTKLATADATAQLRNEYARILAKEVQKLWDSNAGDNRKLRETLTAQAAELGQSLRDRSEFEMHFVQGLTGAAEERHDDCVVHFRQALMAYKSGKPRNVLESKAGAIVARYVLESLRKKHGDDCGERVREELADPLYNDLEEELALAALQSPWLAPLIKERNPVPPAPAAPEPAAEPRPVAANPAVMPVEPDSEIGEEADSCRLLNG
ncbi:MAG TPA: hypothetical protein VL128_03590 [Candidatus Eisenbacteria bacterium]|nr:hypothetical protein [Candidatus Eisenbacteria bacterium]